MRSYLKILYAVLFILLLTNLSYGKEVQNFNYRSYLAYSRGLLSSNSKLWSSALKQYRLTSRYDPDSILINRLLSDIFLHLNKWKEATWYLERLNKLDGKLIDVYYSLAEAYLGQKEYNKVIQILKKGTETFPDNASMFLYLGKSYFINKNYEETKKTLLKSIEIDDKNPKPHYTLGILYDKIKNSDKAMNEFKKVIELDPEYADAYNYIGYSYAEKGIKLDEALSLIKKAVVLKPESGAFIDSLGWVYYKKQMYGESIKCLERASKLIGKADLHIILDHLGEAYLKKSMPGKAIETWKRILKFMPDNEEIQEKIKKAERRHTDKK